MARNPGRPTLPGFEPAGTLEYIKAVKLANTRAWRRTVHRQTLPLQVTLVHTSTRVVDPENTEGADLQRKLEYLNSIVDQEQRAEQARRQMQYFGHCKYEISSTYLSECLLY